ncbi:OmpA family protein [Gilvimarinus xylanilyticus]|uniref:OmpA family protein n=1 Tax=Gilvimarinus xylanilyticus TaxID=2944139 RepID=A0A9X2KWQ4_9GAMM|nr:OmpA family protein [Gilvimarinus xylanilyticus]MCP8899295.1 OmpA family protein [Gilvimarinus xylanilyticus]
MAKCKPIVWCFFLACVVPFAQAEPDTTEPASDSSAELGPQIVAVHFEFDSADLQPLAKTQLLGVIDDARELGVEYTAGVKGHTDAQGPEWYNQTLSRQRAESVVEYLQMQRAGATQWQVDGLGESQPVASNDEESGRAQNRRVEVTFTPASASAQPQTVSR